MATGYALIDRPNPFYVQGRPTRRNGATVAGLAVIHTAENAPDLHGDDIGAEAVVKYLQTRKTPGCYHTISDADSTIRAYPYAWETWQCRWTNNWSNGFSMATEAGAWDRMDPVRRDAVLRNCASAVVDFIEWCDDRGVHVPVRWIDRGAAMRRERGLITHGETDPTRRTDPGFGPSLRAQFLQMVGDLASSPSRPPVVVVVPSGPQPGTLGLAADGAFGPVTVRALQTALGRVGEQPGPVDGVFGPRTAAAHQRWLIRCGFYRGALDGDFGPESTKAEQRWLRSHRHYPGLIDGERGPVTIAGLQLALNARRIA